QVPFLFDLPPRSVRSDDLLRALASAARRIDTLAVAPLSYATSIEASPHVVPWMRLQDETGLDRLRWAPRMMLVEGWDRDTFDRLKRRLPDTLLGVRLPAEEDPSEMVRAGVRIFQLVADDAGRAGGRFIAEVIQERHKRLVEEGVREEVTL